MKYLLSIGFRLFFIGASLHALLLMSFWVGISYFNLNHNFNGLSIYQWHAHELIFGYVGAVIAGFLLTAVTKWTGKKTLTGLPLLILFTLWLVARIAWFLAPHLQLLLSLLDTSFIFFLLIALAKPIIQSKQWPQLAITSKILLILIANIIFYTGSMNIISQGVHTGIYLGLIIEIALILTILRRIFPTFAQLGLSLNEPLPSPPWLDNASIALSLLWAIAFLANPEHLIVALISLALFITLSIRLWNWFEPSFWKVPLLWSLYLGLVWIAIGYAMLSLAFFNTAFHYTGIHALTYGGIGLISLSMMARVSLGHTGRNVRSSDPKLAATFIIFSSGIFFRVLMPIALPQFMNIWIMGAQLLWILGFLFFLLIFLPILTSKNIKSQ